MKTTTILVLPSFYDCGGKYWPATSCLLDNPDVVAMHEA